MSYDITSALTPKWKENGQDDFRYKADIQTIIELTGVTALDGLRKFYEETSKLEYEYSQYALRLCTSFWEASKGFDDWKKNAIKKQLLVFLKEIGFKAVKASALIGAARLQFDFCKYDSIWEDFSGEPHKQNALEWVKSLKLFPQYDLSRMSSIGVWHAYYHLSDKGTKTVTREQLRELQQEHPRNESEHRGRPRGSNLDQYSDESESIVEVVQSEEERFFNALEALNLEAQICDPIFRERLHKNEVSIRILASWLPHKTKPTLSTII